MSMVQHTSESKSIGWEWDKNWEVLTLSRRMIVPLFMFGGFAGGLSLIIASIFIPGFFGSGSWVNLLGFGALGAVLIWLGLRPRVVRFFPSTKIIQVGWGVRGTWVYKTYLPTDWIALSVQIVHPVVITPVGQVMRATSLPPYWKLTGKTGQGKHIFLAEYPNEEKARLGKAYFEQQFQIKT